MNPFSRRRDGGGGFSAKMKGKRGRPCNVEYPSNAEYFHRNGALLLQKRILYLKGKDNPIRIFCEEELKKATNNYNPSRCLSEEGFSCMFKGIVDDREVAVKREHGKPNDSSRVERVEELMTEVVILSGINHRHVVKFLGCCLETEVPILVYEFISNCSTLSDCIFPRGSGDHQVLPWSDRLRVATEVADALNYLHSYPSMAIVHRDIKSDNILLDEYHSAKISGFDLMLPIATDKMILEDVPVAGTLGYLDPEYHVSGVLTEKSDVYNFGVVLLRLLTGKDAIVRLNEGEPITVELFISRMGEGRVAEILEARVVKEGRTEQIQAFAEVAMRCVESEREFRPRMKEVVQELRQITRMRPLRSKQSQEPG